MKTRVIPQILALAALLLIPGACSDPSFTVDGSIDGADGKTIILEKADHAGLWIPLDSVKLKESGNFKFKQIAPAAPEIYRLSLDGSYIYFPVDSTENIKVQAPASAFATAFTLSGSENAETLARFEKELIANASKLAIPDSARAFKRNIYTKYLQDSKGSVVSYYILTKTVGDKALFGEAEDYRYIAAVATAFRQFSPEDPRTLLLEQTATQAMRRSNAMQGKKTVMEAQEISYIPITLPDESDTNIALSQIAGQGKPTVLLFTNLTDDATPALNMELKKLVDAGTVNIYNVSFDDDPLLWRNAARNLPWTTVYADMASTRTIVSDYQLDRLPVMFLITSDGTLKARCATVADLRKAL